MARIFLTEAEAQQWGLLPKKWWDSPTIKQKVVIRVVAGLTLLGVLTLTSFLAPLVGVWTS